MSGPRTVTVTDHDGAKEVLRHKQLRQALYDEGDVVMADVLVNLHGDAHRDRRRLENPVFRSEVHRHYEHDAFPQLVQDTIGPHVASGGAELVSLSHQLMMNLAALTAGVDRPLGTAEESLHLYGYLMKFIEGATLAHYEGDRDARRQEVADALQRFEAEFFAPSVQRRRDLLGLVGSGALDESELPVDVLTALLANRDRLELPDDVVLRETVFYLLAGAHTSATAFVRTLDAVFDLDVRDPELARRARSDLEVLQRCVHETIRLHPSSPVAMRWALEDVELRSGVRLAAGDKVVVDLVAANRDPAVFGDHPERFDPDRPLEDGVARWGLSFGSGMHACIGQQLAAGGGADSGRARLVGLVPVAVRAVLDAGAAPDPDDPARLDPTSARGYWARYPVRLGAPR
jgi:cytochrome P450